MIASPYPGPHNDSWVWSSPLITLLFWLLDQIEADDENTGTNVSHPQLSSERRVRTGLTDTYFNFGLVYTPNCYIRINLFRLFGLLGWYLGIKSCSSVWMDILLVNSITWATIGQILHIHPQRLELSPLSPAVSNRFRDPTSWVISISVFCSLNLILTVIYSLIARFRATDFHNSC